MWNWFFRMFPSGKKPTKAPTGETLVRDEEYEFKVGTKAMLPDGLRELKITEIRNGLLLLENFDVDLTVDQKYMDRTVEDIAMAVRVLRWAKGYHGLEDQFVPPVKLHRGNVLLSDSHYSDNNRPDADIASWLERMCWDGNRPFAVHHATTSNPLEDGYFSCLRITVGSPPDEPESPLVWTACEFQPVSLVATLAGFVHQEMAQPWWNHCERYLQQCYSVMTREQLTHPVFALLDFPAFHQGMVSTTFAGSVWSKDELRFWSRPTYFHK